MPQLSQRDAARREAELLSQLKLADESNEVTTVLLFHCILLAVSPGLPISLTAADCVPTILLAMNLVLHLVSSVFDI